MERKTKSAGPWPVLFLDRDGTINVDPGYLDQPKNLRIYYGVRQGIMRFRRAGYKIIVVSNQSGVGRGLVRKEAVYRIERRLREKLGRSAPDAFYYCFHKPNEHCRCRKPNPGLFELAQRDYPLDKGRSLMIGDKISDIEAAAEFGIPSMLVQSGDGGQNYISPGGFKRYMGMVATIGEAYDRMRNGSMQKVGRR